MGSIPWRKMTVSSAGFLRRTIHSSVILSKLKLDSSNRPILELDGEVEDQLRKGVKLGRKTIPCVEPPERVTKILQRLLKHDEVKHGVGLSLGHYYDMGERMKRYYKNRHLPLDARITAILKEEIQESVEKEFGFVLKKIDENDFMERNEIKVAMERRVQELLKKRTNLWKAVEYDHDTCWAYLFGRGPLDYAAITFVLKEIKSRCPAFSPRTHFDFGSGVGTCSWAIKEEFGDLREEFYVDSSSEMQDLARTIYLEGKLRAQLPPSVFFRLHFPAKSDLKYDIVTSTFSLMEMESTEERLNTVDKLWKKTEHGGFLIIIELGTNAGFQAVAEARDYILQLLEVEEQEGHIFAPCPHEMLCPRFTLDTIPCNVDIKYKTFQMNKVPNNVKDIVFHDKMSYVVFKKEKLKEVRWPRLVQEKQKYNNILICEMCTPKGTLEEGKVRREQKLLYRYTKRVQKGEQFKVHLHDKVKPGEEVVDPEDINQEEQIVNNKESQ